MGHVKIVKLGGIAQRQEASLVTQNQVSQASAPAGYALVEAVASEMPFVSKQRIGTVVFEELEKAWWISNQNLRFKHAIRNTIKILSKVPPQLADSVSRGNTENEHDNLHTHSELHDSETTP